MIPPPGSTAMASLAKRWALRFEPRWVPTESQRLFALTVAVGVACGLAAVAFHFSISFAESLLCDRALRAPGREWMFWGVASPLLGGVAAGLLLKYAVPGARGSGVPQVKAAYAGRTPPVPLRDSIGKLIVSSLQIGSGASLGREGPTVHICTGIAGALGRWARLSPLNQRRLTPVGAAAGIAAAFNAPIAAVTFTIEEVVGDLDQTVLSGVIVAAALAAVIERSILGTHPVFAVPHTYGLADARSLLVYAALGVTAGLVSVLFTELLLATRARFRAQSRLPVWLQPGVGGAFTGVITVAVLYFIGIGGINGAGYAVIEASLSSHLPLRALLVLCCAKLVATVFSYSSGGAGGIFAPSLFIGAMLGGAFGSLDRYLFQHGDEALGAFALVGMGATFCGTIRAPITSVLIIIELTSGYGLILPLMIANMSAYAVARWLKPTPIYEALLEQDGIQLRSHLRTPQLEHVLLGSLPLAAPERARVGTSALAAELLRSPLGPGNHVFLVVDGAGKTVGLITSEDLALLGEDARLARLIAASDIMRPFMAVQVNDTLLAAWELMRDQRLPELPVLDATGDVVGFIDETTLARSVLQRSHPSA